MRHTEPLSDRQPPGPGPKPADLDARESQRWDHECCELDRALERGDEAGSQHALAMLDRLRYGCR